MGARGTGSFDNDDAGDWAVELEEAEGTGAITAAFDAVLEVGDDFLELPDAGVGIAAADVVAALLGRPSPDLPPEVAAWVAGKPPPEAGLVKKAQKVVRRVLEDSELKELWSESAGADQWRQGVEELLRRLDAAGD